MINMNFQKLFDTDIR